MAREGQCGVCGAKLANKRAKRCGGCCKITSLAELRQRIIAWCTERGGKRTSEEIFVDRVGVLGGTFEVPTKVGPWFVHLPSDETIDVYSVNTRFADVDRAKEHFGIDRLFQGRLNPYSGKWNFTYSGELDEEHIFADFTENAAELFRAITHGVPEDK